MLFSHHCTPSVSTEPDTRHAHNTSAVGQANGISPPVWSTQSWGFNPPLNPRGASYSAGTREPSEQHREVGVEHTLNMTKSLAM